MCYKILNFDQNIFAVRKMEYLLMYMAVKMEDIQNVYIMDKVTIIAIKIKN